MLNHLRHIATIGYGLTAIVSLLAVGHLGDDPWAWAVVNAVAWLFWFKWVGVGAQWAKGEVVSWFLSGLVGVASCWLFNISFWGYSPFLSWGWGIFIFTFWGIAGVETFKLNSTVCANIHPKRYTERYKEGLQGSQYSTWNKFGALVMMSLLLWQGIRVLPYIFSF